MPTGQPKDKFDLRWIIEDSDGNTTSYISKSIFNSLYGR